MRHFRSSLLFVGLLLIGAGCSQTAPTPAPVNNTNTVVPANTNSGTEDNRQMETNSNTNGNTNTTTNDPNSAVKSFTVDASNFAFSLKEMKVKQGDRVRIVFNNQSGFHDWKIDEFDAATKQLQAGQSETVEFVADKTGTFEYYCSVGQHRAMGMKGNLIVE